MTGKGVRVSGLWEPGASVPVGDEESGGGGEEKTHMREDAGETGDVTPRE